MTRDEMEELKGLAASMGLYDDKNPCKRAVILGKTIKALEQQTCEDAISREDALMALTGEWTEPIDELIHRFIRRIKNLPPVNPQQTKWIPVSERLPEENKTVMASTKFGVYPEVRYSKEYGWEWAYEAGADYWEELKATVTAWMPLPQPYEPQESEEV